MAGTRIGDLPSATDLLSTDFYPIARGIETYKLPGNSILPITEEKIATEAVSTRTLAGSAVTTDKINRNTITLDKIQRSDIADRVLGYDSATDDVKILQVNNNMLSNFAVTNEKIANSTISNAKLSSVPANSVKVNNTASAANPTDLAMAANSVLGRQSSNLTSIAGSDDTVLAKSGASDIAFGKVTGSMVQSNSLPNSLLSNVNQNTIKGRISPNAGSVEDLTGVQARTIINAVNRAGDTMTGFLTCNDDPTYILHAATKRYVDSLINTLSSNMQNIGNYPYARLFENLASANVSIGTTFQNRIYTGLEETATSFINNQGSGNFNFKSTGVYQCKIHLPTHLESNLAYTGSLYYTTTVQFVEGSTVKIIKFTPMLDNMTNANGTSNTPLQHTTHNLVLEGTFTVTSAGTVYKVQQKASNANTILTSLGGQAEFWKLS